MFSIPPPNKSVNRFISFRFWKKRSKTFSAHVPLLKKRSKTCSAHGAVLDKSQPHTREAQQKVDLIGVVPVRIQRQFYSPLASYIALQLYSATAE